MINVGELIYDPDFCQRITVIRTKIKEISYKAAYYETQFETTGIITIADTKSLEMLPEADRLMGAINVFTKEQLYITQTIVSTQQYVPDELYSSDIIVFEGTKYKVMNQLDDMQYGFCKSTCVRMERS